MLRPFNNMRAQAVTIFAFCPGPGVVPKVKQAELKGQLVERVAPFVRSSTFTAALPSIPATSAIPPAAVFFEAAKGGDATSSWHAVFQPDGHSRTLTEMEEDGEAFPGPNAVRDAVLHELLASELHAMRREREEMVFTVDLNEVRLRC
jgi:hypothetical protein